MFDDPIIDRTRHRENVVHISARTGDGCDKLCDMLVKIVGDGKASAVFRIPNAEQGALNRLYKDAVVEEVEYGPEYVTVRATVDSKVRGMLKKYDVEPPLTEEY